jgi:carboxyl-terminal processing protease
MMVRDRIQLLALVTALSALIAATRMTAADSPPAAPAWKAAGEKVVALVGEHFYDAQRASAWVEAHRRYFDLADSAQQFAEHTRRALSELQASHLGYYTPRDAEYYGLRAIFQRALKLDNVEYDSLGADVSAEGFVRVVFAGGAAAQAGLRRGDRILKANGQDFHRVLSVEGQAGKALLLSVQRHASEPEIEVTVTPKRVDPKQEWLEAQQGGAQVFRRQGKAVGYIPIFSCAGEQYRAALQDAIAKNFVAADALIVDFRNGWGGCQPNFVDVFNRSTPTLTVIERDGQEKGADRHWRKPLYLLINGGSRSGKEIVAFAVQKYGLGTLVGEETAGAVLAGATFMLPDESLLYLPVADVRVDGERLEGRRVTPDVAVADALAFADGTDPQLEKALELASSERRSLAPLAGRGSG